MTQYLGETNSVHSKVFHCPDGLLMAEDVRSSSGVVNMMMSIKRLVAKNGESFVLSSSLNRTVKIFDDKTFPYLEIFPITLVCP